MSSLIGKQLQGGKYKLETVLGRGGFGLTFRAHQNYLDHTVVIKTLNEAHWQAPNISDLQRQFQDEARRLAMCSHPNVVRVSDFFIEDALPYMVMDYIPGRSLYDIVIPSNPLPVKAAVSYITQIGNALQAVHAKGLLHRDVKPQNIMIHAQTGDAILIDFGIARELTQNPAQTHTSIVSEGYAPIEQYLPKAHRSAATDIYGLAATLYTLLTAEIPTAAVLRDRDPITPIGQLRSDIHESMAVAIERGMSVELRDRPQSVGRWLTMLTQPSTQSSATLSHASARPTRSRSAPLPATPLPSPSEYPTKVVAPAAHPYATNSSQTSKTLAVSPTDDYEQGSVTPQTYSPTKKKSGFGCLSFLGLLSLAVVGAFAASGFWLYQQFAENAASSPSAPEIERSVEPEAIEDPEETDDEPVEDSIEEALEDNEPEENSEEENPEVIAPPSPSETTSATPPTALSDVGNPANDRPGDPGNNIPPSPGFSPGTNRSKIVARLGQPTEEYSTDSFYVAKYEQVPNRIVLSHTYDQGSQQVRQSEAAFAPSTSRSIMQSTMGGMLGRSFSSEMIDNLDSVIDGSRDRVSLNTSNITGAIERNANGYIHIYVQR